MLTSSFVRRILMLFGVYGLLCVVILGVVGMSVPGTEPGVSVLRWRVILSGFILLAIGLVIMIQVLRNFISPINELSRAVKAVINDQSPERIDVERFDELGVLSQSFNQMVQAIEARTASSQSKQQRIESDAEQLETVLEAMVEGVIAVDQEERILLANMAAIRLLDLKTFNVVGRRMWEVVRSPQIHELVRSTLSDNEQRRLEISVPWTYSTVAAIASRLPGDPCPGAVLVLHDVTDLRRLENLRRDFVSNVSHELKTPLAAITAYTETLLSGALEDQNVSRMFVGRISEQSERLNSLIFDLLELARIESGEHMFQVNSIEINEVLQNSVDAHLPIAQTKQLELTTDFREDRLMGRADSDGLRTIIDNLIGNAIKYSHPGGQITVRSYRSRDGVLFEVEDNGVGIAKEFQSRIFERFFRVDRARSREMGGTGLGLSIVKHLCNLFGGNVRVKSQLGQGSTFTVQLESSE
jgi:two-component system phosphate regulon sensor histidine kinase PhoR